MNQMIFTKYSAERSRKFAIRTDIVKKEDGTLEVEKRALYPEGQAHVAAIFRWYELLSKEYEKDQFLVNRCTETPEGVSLEYLTGETLQQRIERLAKDGREAEITSWVEQYLEKMTRGNQWIPYEKTDEFVRVFGDVPLPEGLKCRSVTNIDMIFSNVVLEGQHWHLIDYEWTFDFPIPLNFVLYRSCFLASHEIAGVPCLKLSLLMQRLGIGAKEQKLYDAMEAHFQDYIRDYTVPVRDLLSDTGYRVIPMSEVEARFGESSLPKMTVSCAGADGNHFQRQPEAKILPVGTEGARLLLTLPEGMERLKLTIGTGSCLIRIKSWLVEQKAQSVEGLTANGMDLGGGLYLVMAEAAELEFTCVGGAAVEIQLQIQVMNPSVNQAFVERMNSLYGQWKAVEDELILLKNSKYYKVYEKLKRLSKR